MFDFQLFKDFLPILTTGGAIISAAGLIPRIGPGRAVMLYLRSRFASRPKPESVRVEEIGLLKKEIRLKDFGQSYLVVTGEKGVGKTCLLDTVLSKTPGVITMEAQPNHSEDTVIKNALQRLTRIPFDFVPCYESARRVIFWYRFFTIGRSPIIVINAAERKVGQEYAGLTGAVRTLVDKYKLRVIIDSSPNSLDESLLRTKRQRIVEIQPMTKNMVWQMNEPQDLFKYVKEAGLNDVMFAVLGGVPAGYYGLWGNVRFKLQNGDNPRKVIGDRLCAEISAAIDSINDSKSATYDMEEIIKLFDKGTMCIPTQLLVDKRLKRPTPDKVFRKVEKDGLFVLVPTSNAINIVLQNNLNRKPSLEELENMIKLKE